ncbi:Iron reductase [Mycena venus]|uniref:Iron reductase n=1 Tax=Mycena venus TaxID=2733690 RepID=A0A8H6XYH8_9AGAR|nr:Iron reductase [Mycena venus]
MEHPKWAGFLALAQLPPVFLLASDNSRLTALLLGPGVNYTKLNYIHRWASRFPFLGAVVYGSLWINNHRVRFLFLRSSTFLPSSTPFVDSSVRSLPSPQYSLLHTPTPDHPPCLPIPPPRPCTPPHQLVQHSNREHRPAPTREELHALKVACAEGGPAVRTLEDELWRASGEGGYVSLPLLFLHFPSAFCILFPSYDSHPYTLASSLSQLPSVLLFASKNSPPTPLLSCDKTAASGVVASVSCERRALADLRECTAFLSLGDGANGPRTLRATLAELCVAM